MVGKVTVLRIGHRYVRDYRVTMHTALVARAFGAHKMLLASYDDTIIKGIEEVNARWGGDFMVTCIGDRWLEYIKGFKSSGSLIVHLTMYGLHIDDTIDDIRRRFSSSDIMVVIGAEKVPRVVYDISDYNVAIGNQPHSEIAALALFLDRLFEGKELKIDFRGRLRIIPTARGKRVIEMSDEYERQDT
jgi:tRNA (cytidine56-2'-O)-methyltransferase